MMALRNGRDDVRQSFNATGCIGGVPVRDNDHGIAVPGPLIGPKSMHCRHHFHVVSCAFGAAGVFSIEKQLEMNAAQYLDQQMAAQTIGFWALLPSRFVPINWYRVPVNWYR